MREIAPADMTPAERAAFGLAPTTELPTDTRLWPHGTSTGYNDRRCRCDACRSWMRQAQRDRRRRDGRRTRAQQRADEKNAALAAAAAFRADSIDPRHGTTTGYSAGCRCERCTAANTQRHQQQTAGARRRPTPAHVHGTVNGYSYWGCRCPECYAAQSIRNREGKQRRRAARERAQ